MDLPKKTLGIRLAGEPVGGNGKSRAKTRKRAKRVSVNDEKIFEPKLEIIPGKKKIIQDLRAAASSAPAVYLAGDPDPEGEALCAHLAQVLSKPSRFAVPAHEQEKAKGAEAEDPNTKEPPTHAKATLVRPVDPKNIFRVSFSAITPQ